MKPRAIILKAILCAVLLTVQLAPATVRAQAPTVLSVKDILSNYGIDSNWVNDTVGVVIYLNQQPRDYVALTNLCVSIRTRAKNAIESLENDYEHRDDLIWIDSNTVVSDYAIYEYHLRRLADLMGRMGMRYSRMEQQRMEAAREEARIRATEETQRQQAEINRAAEELIKEVELHHSAILSATSDKGVSDRAKRLELRDIHYSYLMVYNKYDRSAGHASKESIDKLRELSSFQVDLLENVLGQNSLPSQIENFKNVLKVRCENGNSDIYRSYSRVFKHTSVKVAFANLDEYNSYIDQLRNIVSTQARYLQTIDLRATIAAGNEAILQKYGKKYRDVANSYRDVLATVNQLPSFTNTSESVLFIQALERFIEAQQIYLDDYSLLEELSARSDSILQTKMNRFRDVAEAYRSIEPTLRTMPTFKDPEGAASYENRLAAMYTVQQCYLDIIALREIIARNEDTLAETRKVDRMLWNGSRLLRRQTNLSPQFATLEHGHSFINSLEQYIETQELCIRILNKRRVMIANEKIINDKESPYHNIAKAYRRTAKAYEGLSELTNVEDMRRYDRQCDRILELQEAFIKTLRGPNAADSDHRLKKETDIKKVKLLVGMSE